MNLGEFHSIIVITAVIQRVQPRRNHNFPAFHQAFINKHKSSHHIQDKILVCQSIQVIYHYFIFLWLPQTHQAIFSKIYNANTGPKSRECKEMNECLSLTCYVHKNIINPNQKVPTWINTVQQKEFSSQLKFPVRDRHRCLSESILVKVNIFQGKLNAEEIYLPSSNHRGL